MSDSIIHETTTTLPASFVIKEQPGGRYQLVVLKNQGNQWVEDYLNFYDEEQLYLHVDQGCLTYTVTKSRQEESKIRRRLRALVWVFLNTFTGKLPKEF